MRAIPGDDPPMTTSPITGDQRFVKAINRNVLLRLLLDEPAQSRAALAERSGLTKSTVSLLTKELLDEGWLAEDGVAPTGSLGRRPTPLRIAGRGLVLIGAELGTDTIRVATLSLHGDVLESTSVPLQDRNPDVACHQMVKLVTRQSARVTQAGARLLGVGVGLPGAIDTAHGIIEFAPNLGWHNVEVGQRLARELDAAALGQVPVYCQNEADLAAIGEVVFGSRPTDDPLVYVSCSVGVGSGIVLNGALFTGATGSAGEIGHTILHIDGLPCSCGRRGCAEAYVGLKAVARAAGFLRGDEVDRDGPRRRPRATLARARRARPSARPATRWACCCRTRGRRSTRRRSCWAGRRSRWAARTSWTPPSSAWRATRATPACRRRWCASRATATWPRPSAALPSR